MKNMIVLLLFIFHLNTSAQRYLTNVFNELDSVISATYGNAVDREGSPQNLLFDFYAPSDDNLEERPLVIYIHGGGFTSGTRMHPSAKNCYVRGWPKEAMPWQALITG